MNIRLFCVLALTTDGRWSVILQLTWDRVNFERGLIRLGVVGEKDRKGRAVVPMTERARQELAKAKEAAQSPYVIEYGGESVLDIKKGFAASAGRAKMRETVPHDFATVQLYGWPRPASAWAKSRSFSATQVRASLQSLRPRLSNLPEGRFSARILTEMVYLNRWPPLKSLVSD